MSNTPEPPHRGFANHQTMVVACALNDDQGLYNVMSWAAQNRWDYVKLALILKEIKPEGVSDILWDDTRLNQKELTEIIWECINK